MYEIHGKKMVLHNNYTYKIEKWVDTCANKNINFHSYVIKIHNLGPIFAYGLQGHN
jgi:hypothetical protein